MYIQKTKAFQIRSISFIRKKWRQFCSTWTKQASSYGSTSVDSILPMLMCLTCRRIRHTCTKVIGFPSCTRIWLLGFTVNLQIRCCKLTLHPLGGIILHIPWISPRSPMELIYSIGSCHSSAVGWSTGASCNVVLLEGAILSLWTPGIFSKVLLWGLLLSEVDLADFFTPSGVLGLFFEPGGRPRPRLTGVAGSCCKASWVILWLISSWLLVLVWGSSKVSMT